MNKHKNTPHTDLQGDEADQTIDLFGEKLDAATTCPPDDDKPSTRASDRVDEALTTAAEREKERK